MLCVMSENVDSVRGWAMVLEYIRLRTFAVSFAVLNLYEVLDIVTLYILVLLLSWNMILT